MRLIRVPKEIFWKRSISDGVLVFESIGSGQFDNKSAGTKTRDTNKVLKNT